MHRSCSLSCRHQNQAARHHERTAIPDVLGKTAPSQCDCCTNASTLCSAFTHLIQETEKAAFLVRQHVHYNLYDRIRSAEGTGREGEGKEQGGSGSRKGGREGAGREGAGVWRERGGREQEYEGREQEGNKEGAWREGGREGRREGAGPWKLLNGYQLGQVTFFLVMYCTHRFTNVVLPNIEMFMCVCTTVLVHF